MRSCCSGSAALDGFVLAADDGLRLWRVGAVDSAS
jgi:hypothetical protein